MSLLSSYFVMAFSLPRDVLDESGIELSQLLRIFSTYLFIAKAVVPITQIGESRIVQQLTVQGIMVLKYNKIYDTIRR